MDCVTCKFFFFNVTLPVCGATTKYEERRNFCFAGRKEVATNIQLGQLERMKYQFEECIGRGSHRAKA